MAEKTRVLFTLIAVLGTCLNLPADLSAQEALPGHVLRIEIRGAIGPATKEHIIKGLEHASESGARLTIIEIDTPGGLDTSMRDIIKAILASDVPVASFVSPSGSRAASAGTYILYASHLAVMAPATNLGAATPVQIGGGAAPSFPKPGGGNGNTGDTDQSAAETGDDSGDDAGDDSGASAPAPEAGTAMEHKAINDAVAYIRSLAELRGRNADWAESAVREAASLSAEDALEQNVIDLIVNDIPELLQAVNGMKIRLGGTADPDTEIELETTALTIENFEPDWRTRMLAVITDPNIAYLLMLVGIYGLLFEGYNPGAILPGVVGAICLLLALFAFQLLPVNFAGLALILLGLALIAAEAFVPSFGTLGLGGIAAFVFGSIILFDSDIPGFSLSLSVVLTVAAGAGLLMFGMMIMLARTRWRKVVSGAEGMLGETGKALEDFSAEGAVFVHGERWNARTQQALKKGEKIRVTKINGLLLDVESADPSHIGVQRC